MDEIPDSLTPEQVERLKELTLGATSQGGGLFGISDPFGDNPTVTVAVCSVEGCENRATSHDEAEDTLVCDKHYRPSSSN